MRPTNKYCSIDNYIVLLYISKVNILNHFYQIQLKENTFITNTYSVRWVIFLTNTRSGTFVNWFLFTLSSRNCVTSDKAIVKLSPSLLTLTSLIMNKLQVKIIYCLSTSMNNNYLKTKSAYNFLSSGTWSSESNSKLAILLFFNSLKNKKKQIVFINCGHLEKNFLSLIVSVYSRSHERD